MNISTFSLKCLAWLWLTAVGLFNFSSVKSQVYATLPYSTGFETPALGASWTSSSSLSTGEVKHFTAITATCVPHSGSQFLGMHHPAAGAGAYNLNGSYLHLNLLGKTNVVLEFWWAEWNDESEPDDGVFISNNDGVSYIKILDLPGALYNDLQWYHFRIDMDSAIAATSLSYTSKFIIKIQQYDNYYFNGGNDGHMYDDLIIYEDCVPVSSFQYTSNYPSGKTITFQNTSSYLTGALWKFGDGDTSHATHPVHTYSAAGKYNVCLEVTAGCGADTVCDTIAVCDSLGAGFSFNRNSLELSFNNTSTDTSDIYWTFGDGQTSTKANPVHTFSLEKTYSVCMTAKNNCETLKKCEAIKVCEAIHPSFTVTSFGGPSYTFTYNGTGKTPTSYHYDFGDGNSDTNQVSLHTYTTNGSFNVTLTVSNACGEEYDTTLALNVTAAGIAQYNTANDLKIIPNPNKGKFTLDLPLLWNNIEIMSMDGRVVYQQSSENEVGSNKLHIDLNERAGVYLIKLETGSEVSYHRMVLN